MSIEGEYMVGAIYSIVPEKAVVSIKIDNGYATLSNVEKVDYLERGDLIRGPVNELGQGTFDLIGENFDFTFNAVVTAIKQSEA